MQADLPTFETLDQLVELVRNGTCPYVRWSRGPAADEAQSSTDELTGAPMPGLSANPLAVEDWWGDRSLRTWVARRLYDYRHLEDKRGPGVRAWVFEGEEVARGPDNEPLVKCHRPIAWLGPAVIREATEEVDKQRGEWGPLDRT